MANEPTNTKREAEKDVVVRGEPLTRGENLSPKDAAFRNIIQTWNGGERKLAGARASELIYGGSKKPNEALQNELLETLPGIGDYISAPVSGTVVDTVQDKGYESAQTPANMSSDEAKAEQNAIDDTLEAGRKAREDKRDINKDTVGSTELNPPENLPGQPNEPFGGKGDHDNSGKVGGSKYRKAK